ncbi:F-box protein At5g49610 [Helianthus annuus]|uniref:F-box protein At5g49610 n=1 Tax=Helianthus annuus TaxID=4232 RepID=UPI00165337DA|nr:F-box protein At5g49610 [Helianthus annuus]
MEDVLPESVMLDVLSRLPAKAIIRFKRVCRKWRDLVSDPYFVHLHHSRSREALMIDWQGSLEWVEMMEHEDEYHLHPVKSLSILIDPSFSFAGSVNGLICCYRPYDSVYILNPVLKEYMILPKPQLENVIYTYGFGVSTAGEYKVILCNRTGHEVPSGWPFGLGSINTRLGIRECVEADTGARELHHHIAAPHHHRRPVNQQRLADLRPEVNRGNSNSSLLNSESERRDLALDMSQNDDEDSMYKF